MESLKDLYTHYGPLDTEVVDATNGSYFGLIMHEASASEIQDTFEEVPKEE